MQLKKIKNFTSVPQSVVIEGDQVVLDSNKEQFFPLEVANQFLAECGDSVKEVNIAQVYKESANTKLVYLANMTGNPDAPATVKVKQPTKGVWGWHDTENPLRKARDLVFRMKGPQVEYQGKEGTEGLNSFGGMFDIPRYTRRAFEPAIARWITTRDARAEQHYRGQVIESRAVEFAPDAEWALDDIRLFLQLCDPTVDLGPEQKSIEDEYVGAAEDEQAIKMYEAKELALQRVHFRISDPQYPLPTEKAFNAVKKKHGTPVAPTKRGPGRPRKDQSASA